MSSKNEITSAKLDLEVLQSQLSNRNKNMINEGTVEELKKLLDDPDYGEEFVDCYRDHFNILDSNAKYTSAAYMSAVKFFTLLESDRSIVDAYCLVFPERLKRRLDRGQTKSDITGEASRYNKTDIVNELRKVAGIPVNLLYRHVLHEAILSQADIMRNAKSDMAKQKAGECLIRELKPADDKVLNIKVDDGSKSAIQALQEATEALVIKERRSIESGTPITDILEAKIIKDEDAEVEFPDERD